MTTSAANSENHKIIIGKLRRDLEIFPGENDDCGRKTWLIFDPVSDRYFRLDADSHPIVGAMSQAQEIDDFMEKLARSGIKTDRNKVLETVAFLMQNNLLMPLYGVTEARLSKLRDFKRKMRGHRILSAYLFFRIPLLKPDRFLEWTFDTVKAIFNSWTITIFALLALAGYICLVMNAHRFTEAFINSINVQGLIRYSLAVIIIKCIHEFAHAYAAKNYGVRVRRMGIAFIVFFPRLYTDLTDAWRVPSRQKRFFIDGAGIFSETIIGGIAALLWAYSPPGLTNTIAYYIFAVSMINTFLINGNPFIRYDGYYMLMDVTGIDNLQQRATDRLRGYARRKLFGIDYHFSDNSQGWKKTFLILFGIFSFVYRLFLYTSIILIVYFQFIKAVGIVLLLLEIWLLVLNPLLTEVRMIAKLKEKIKRRNFIFTMSATGVLLLVLLLPLPWSITVPCEVKSAESGIIYLPYRGFLTRLCVNDGDTVRKGQLLLEQANPYLDWELRDAELQQEIAKLELDNLQSSRQTIAQAKVKREELKFQETAMAEFKRKQELLQIFSPVTGTFLQFDRRLKPGKWLEKGEIIGEVFNPAQPEIAAYISQEDLESVNDGDIAVITLNDELKTFRGKISAVNAAPCRLTVSPLLNIFGGPIQCYSSPANNYEFEPLTPCYQITLRLDNPEALPAGRTGTVSLRKFSSIGGNMLRKTLRTLQMEMSF